MDACCARSHWSTGLNPTWCSRTSGTRATAKWKAFRAGSWTRSSTRHLARRVPNDHYPRQLDHPRLPHDEPSLLAETSAYVCPSSWYRLRMTFTMKIPPSIEPPHCLTPNTPRRLCKSASNDMRSRTWQSATKQTDYATSSVSTGSIDSRTTATQELAALGIMSGLPSLHREHSNGPQDRHQHRNRRSAVVWSVLFPRATNFVHAEAFRGLLVPFMAKSFNSSARSGFVAMNEALRARCERIA